MTEASHAEIESLTDDEIQYTDHTCSRVTKIATPIRQAVANIKMTEAEAALTGEKSSQLIVSSPAEKESLTSDEVQYAHHTFSRVTKISTPIRQAYSVVNTKKTGAETAFAGEKLTPIAGEITMSSMDRIINLMKKYTHFDSCSRIIDIGCGQGKPNFHFAIAVNPSLNVGIEIVPLRWFQATTNLIRLCDKALEGKIPYPNCYLLLGNIRDAAILDPFTHIYMFSTG